MSERELWDTRVAEDMVLLARAEVETRQEGEDALLGLWHELGAALRVFGGDIINTPKEEVFYDIQTRRYHYDVFAIVRTKGGYSE